ncbi:hypothetical protein HG263_16565 [Pseudoalteromonas sp. JBTF-M23]|uniref:Uncharacterized protein n=1 Tax=Pseudoalteromonas caenipelagi TaxID=2726988 RepID=A0A849VK27_9GAMM|nr:hypothetical protein [Pseudoalteromonas caenipelagi]
MVVIILAFSQAQAASTKGGVERIYPQDGTVYFRLKDEPCKSTQKNTYWSFSLSDETAKTWFAMLLAAASSGHVVKLGVEQCNPDINQSISYLYIDY